MRFAVNLVKRSYLAAAVITHGIWSLLCLLGSCIKALLAGDGPWQFRVAGVFAAPAGLQRVFAALRAFAPNIVLRRRLVTAYENSGTAIISRRDDVKEVLTRDDDFEVVYEPRMRALTDGSNFFLGMQDVPTYTRDLSNMRLVIRREDIPGTIVPLVAATADGIVAASGGTLDLPQDLAQQVPAQLVSDYFGMPSSGRQQMIGWASSMFWYLFLDLQTDSSVVARGEAAAESCRSYLDGAIAERRTSPTQDDDVLNRCLAMQRAGLPGMDDLSIRNNLLGLAVGAIATISMSSTNALDYLLDSPSALAKAQSAARSGDDQLLAACVLEALRFNPPSPVLYRRAVRDTVVARGTLRARRIPKGTLVFAATVSAMFDQSGVPSPRRFRIDRSPEDYMLWGYGMHACFGSHINEAVIPELLKSLLRQPNLRRAAGPAGRIDTAGTAFPTHMRVEFDVPRD